MESTRSKLTTWTTRGMFVCEKHLSKHDKLVKVPMEKIKDATCEMTGCPEPAIEVVGVRVPVPEELDT